MALRDLFGADVTSLIELFAFDRAYLRPSAAVIYTSSPAEVFAERGDYDASLYVGAMLAERDAELPRLRDAPFEDWRMWVGAPRLRFFGFGERKEPQWVRDYDVGTQPVYSNRRAAHECAMCMNALCAQMVWKAGHELPWPMLVGAGCFKSGLEVGSILEGLDDWRRAFERGESLAGAALRGAAGAGVFVADGRDADGAPRGFGGVFVWKREEATEQSA